MTEAALKTSGLLKTPLHALHLASGAKMVPFAGYDMPVQYDGMGVLKEHLHTRTAAGLFDVSHMGQAILSGDILALEKITPTDIAALKKGDVKYSMLLNDQGGIVDDLMITKWSDNALFLVVNAACKEKDFDYIQKSLGDRVRLEVIHDRALIALQGPKAEDVLARHFEWVKTLSFMTSGVYMNENDLSAGAPWIFITRSGYTGEDGFEISLPTLIAEEFTKLLLADPDVKLIGLGARDSLRLEAGLCLYGHDLDEQTTPVEANLKWVIGKRRCEEKNFSGAEKIMSQMTNGAPRLRVGLKPDGKAPLREGTEIFDGDKKVGVITSGTFGPSVNAPVAMGYVDAAYAKPGTKLNAIVRDIPRPLEIATLPFTPHHYKKG